MACRTVLLLLLLVPTVLVSAARPRDWELPEESGVDGKDIAGTDTEADTEDPVEEAVAVKPEVELQESGEANPVEVKAMGDSSDSGAMADESIAQDSAGTDTEADTEDPLEDAFAVKPAVELQESNEEAKPAEVKATSDSSDSGAVADDTAQGQ